MKIEPSVPLAFWTFFSALVGWTAPDLTSSLECIGNPAYGRWPGSSISRHVQDLHPYRNRIYTSGGEWGNNTGPCPCFAIDPWSVNVSTNEFDAGTDAIYEFKEFSDGRLYTSAVDIHEYAANEGHMFRRDLDGEWKAYKNCHYGSITNLAPQGYYTHNWDFTEYKDKIFVCGYGISSSTNRCETKMSDVTPTLKSCWRKLAPASWTTPAGAQYSAPYGYQMYRRFCAFLPFENDLFCIPTQKTAWKSIQTWNDWEEWRWDEAASRFACQTNAWSSLAPGLTDEMFDFFSFSSGTADLQLWHPTKFKDRVLYVLGGHNYNITPVAGFSAVCENHRVRATRIDLGSAAVRPFDIFATADAVYLAAAEAGATATKVTNSVWKSTDGVAFTKLFTFTSSSHSSALCYFDGWFYLGMGARDCVKTGWPKLTGSDLSGQIFRVRLPQEAKNAVLVASETNAVITCEGATGGAVAFRLESQPATNVTLQVVSTNPRIAPKTSALAFTTSDWATAKTVVFDVAEDDETTDTIRGALVCSPDDGSLYSGSVCIAATNNDFRVVETAPEGLVDLTSPTGPFEATSAGVVSMVPFNDDPNLYQTSNRVCIARTVFDIIYDFGSATNVNACGISNLGVNTPVARAPRSWNFYGSDDKSAWTELDRRRYESDWAAAECRYYSFANAKGYRYYKIGFLANNGDSYTQFGRLEFFSVPSAEPDPARDVPMLVEGAIAVASGSRVFSVSVGNVKEGFYYTAFTSESLTAPFVADRSILATSADAADVLGFELPTTDGPSLFVRIVVTSAPYARGAVLE
jgi:hypothetical protein